MDFVHQHCTICQAYVTHVASVGKPPAWTIVLQHLERLRAERNELSATVDDSTREKDAMNAEFNLTKQRLEYYQNECIRLRLEIDTLKTSPNPSPAQRDSITTPSAAAVTVPAASPQLPPSLRRNNNNRGNPRTIAELEDLMRAAHEPGNFRALNKIKVMCAEAHNTPREQKTPVQQHLLIHWRNPEGSNDTGGHPPSPTQGSRLKTNPRRDDPVEVWFDYLSTHHISWPRGVRRDSNDRPYLPDLKASRTVAQLRPNDATTEPAAMIRFEFMQTVTDIFERQRFYKAILDKYHIEVSPVTDLRPYHFPPPITIESVARHFAQCGVTVHQAQEEIEQWARNYKSW
ncbi:hypothetical protein M378DRAFT_14699 [Amanita muscaria Koide BX008]|uniref:Uncharacterized protein n=1 Tax=Amanita muscaria (strain Koide BX008) TaxID=946122 RepID=A0A0C2WS58_AMAMK|nr:hypothetical protein M378DRAFT_14699 [Amanita muscaria Koide BX008]